MGQAGAVLGDQWSKLLDFWRHMDSLDADGWDKVVAAGNAAGDAASDMGSLSVLVDAAAHGLDRDLVELARRSGDFLRPLAADSGLAVETKAEAVIASAAIAVASANDLRAEARMKELDLGHEEVAAVQAIIVAARTGEIGDGRVFVTPVLESYRIRTGERGPAAI